MSQIAPCRIDARSQRQKCCPESSELRQGVHEGALTNARVNNTPSPATESKFGVEDMVIDSAGLELRVRTGVFTPSRPQRP